MKTRVFFMNNYPPADALSRVLSAEYPAQHLWGMWELRSDFHWALPTRTLASLTARRPHARKFSRLVMPLLGDPVQLWELWKSRKRVDVVYAADQQSATGLLLLRALRLYTKPVVVVIHNGPRLGWTRNMLRYADTLLVLSSTVRDRLNSQLAHPRVLLVRWGPSTESPVYTLLREEAPTSVFDFVAAGKSNRDYAALRNLATAERLSGMLFTPAGVEEYRRGELSVSTRVADYAEVVRALSRARWCVIPLADKDRLSGLTEAADALAVSTPVLTNSVRALPYGDLISVRYYTTAEELRDAITNDRVDAQEVFSDANKVSLNHYAEMLRSVLEDATR